MRVLHSFLSLTHTLCVLCQWLYLSVSMSVCVCVCLQKRERERGSFTVVGSLSKHCSSPSFLGKRRASKHSMNFFDGLSKNQLPLQLTEQKHYCRWNKNLWIIGFSCLMVRPGGILVEQNVLKFISFCHLLVLFVAETV